MWAWQVWQSFAVLFLLLLAMGLALQLVVSFYVDVVSSWAPRCVAVVVAAVAPAAPVSVSAVSVAAAAVFAPASADAADVAAVLWPLLPVAVPSLALMSPSTAHALTRIGHRALWSCCHWHS